MKVCLAGGADNKKFSPAVCPAAGAAREGFLAELPGPSEFPAIPGSWREQGCQGLGRCLTLRTKGCGHYGWSVYVVRNAAMCVAPSVYT
jgi:hypothetical protein